MYRVYCGFLCINVVFIYLLSRGHNCVNQIQTYLSFYPERSCTWAPVILVLFLVLVPSLMALGATDPHSLNQSAWRTLARKNNSMEMWRVTSLKWWQNLRLHSCSPQNCGESASSRWSPNLQYSIFDLRTSVRQPSGSILDYRKLHARYT